jgi:tRNA(fMet)-specific endonuclease VapC
MLRQGSTEEWAVSAVTMSEVLFGLERARTAQQRSDRQDFIEMILAIYPVLPFDISAARTYARIWAELVNSGQRMHDFMIAATALTYDYALLTDNVREFSRVPGLTVRQPSW